MKFVKYVSKTKVEEAPKLLILGAKKYIANPLPKHYIAAGYLELVDERPADEEGFTYERKGYSKKNGKVYVNYEKVAVEVENGNEEVEA